MINVSCKPKLVNPAIKKWCLDSREQLWLKKGADGLPDFPHEQSLLPQSNLSKNNINLSHEKNLYFPLNPGQLMGILLILIPIWLGSKTPYITQPARVCLIAHLTTPAWKASRLCEGISSGNPKCTTGHMPWSLWNKPIKVRYLSTGPSPKKTCQGEWREPKHLNGSGHCSKEMPWRSACVIGTARCSL